MLPGKTASGKPPATRVSSAGVTLIEGAIVTTLSIVVIGGAALAVRALTSHTIELQTSRLSHQEADRARVALANDFELADPLAYDEYGNPFFEVFSKGSAIASVVRFRTVRGFETDRTGQVRMVYGSPIVYDVDRFGNLIRMQEDDVRVVAIHIRAISFQVTPSGTVLVDVTTYENSAADPESDLRTRFAIPTRSRVAR